MSALELLALAAAGGGAGAINALAGGGTLVSFPALVLAGLPAKVANATSTVALVPGSAASLAGYWPEVRTHRRWIAALLLPSLVGGALGSLLLLATPERWFERAAPLLVLFATALFAAQNRRRDRVAAPVDAPESAAAGPRTRLAQFGVAIYGGYFGAGIGILMLALLAALRLTNIHAMNGLKNLFGICINGVAAAVFVISGAVDWRACLPVLAGSVAGGYFGARVNRRLGQAWARRAVVILGCLVALALAWQQI